jgi:hypothetical protein
LGRGLHFAEHLSNGELFVEEESLDLGRGDRDGACRDAGRLAIADKVDFAALGYGLFGRSCVRAGRCVGVDSLDIDAV